MILGLRHAPWRSRISLATLLIGTLAACQYADSNIIPAGQQSVIGIWRDQQGTQVELRTDHSFQVSHWPVTSTSQSTIFRGDYRGTWSIVIPGKGLPADVDLSFAALADDLSPYDELALTRRNSGLVMCIDIDPDDPCFAGELTRQPN